MDGDQVIFDTVKHRNIWHGYGARALKNKGPNISSLSKWMPNSWVMTQNVFNRFPCPLSCSPPKNRRTHRFSSAVFRPNVTKQMVLAH
jgi:hypothetical protein